MSKYSYPPLSEEERKEAAEGFENWSTEYLRGYREALCEFLTALPGYYGRRRGSWKRIEGYIVQGLRVTAAAIEMRGEELIPGLRKEED